MYIIIEKSEGRLYAYRETAAQFKVMEKAYRNSMQKLTPQALDDECDLSDLPNNAYLVFKIEDRKPGKKLKTKKKV